MDTGTTACEYSKSAKNVDPYFYRPSGLVVTIDWVMCIQQEALFVEFGSAGQKRDPLRKVITASEPKKFFHRARYTAPKFAIVQTPHTIRKTIVARSIGAKKRSICSHQRGGDCHCQKLIFQGALGVSAAKNVPAGCRETRQWSSVDIGRLCFLFFDLMNRSSKKRPCYTSRYHKREKNSQKWAKSLTDAHHPCLRVGKK